MHAELHHIKAAAYAWRQMLFFLSLLGEDAQRAHLAAAREHLATRDDAFRARFRPALDGLGFVLEGGAFDADGRGGEAGEFRRFLGWATEHHWLSTAGRFS